MTLDEAIAMLHELNEEVPKPLRLPTDDEIIVVEKTLGVKLHPDYRKYLREASDVVYGVMEPATITDSSSHTHLTNICKVAWESMGVASSLLPICEDNGNYYCIDASGRIIFWDHNGTSQENWPNLATWIETVWIGGE